MQVAAGLYRRFIHEASLGKIGERFEAVSYSPNKGVKGVFSGLTRYAERMPTPPDEYTFKKHLLYTLPDNMLSDMMKIHHITAESSTVDNIMQAALSCERSAEADRYYQRARKNIKRTKRRRSRSRSRERKSKGKDRKNSRSPSPRRLQIVKNRRYSVKPHSNNNNTQNTWCKRSDDYSPNNQSQNRDYNRLNSNKQGKPQSQAPQDKRKTPQYQSGGRVFRMIDENGDPQPQLFRIEEMINAESTREEPQDNISLHNTESESEHEPYGGSQYTSDAADSPYLESDNESPESTENMGFMREQDHDHEFEQPRLAAIREIDKDSSNESYLPDLQEVLDSSDNESDCTESEENYTMDFGAYIRSMQTSDDGGVHATLNANTSKPPKTGTRPKRTNVENRCLAAFINFNNLQAFALFDSGSTADAISPDFARLAKLKTYQLENPVTLQLGTKGSRSKINYGCTASYQFKTSKETFGSNTGCRLK
ncbi:hypothetical protein VKT23_007930 [Stygiomarasmius scandens]|uniref:Polyprotein n=1 Tax=Marasmiellus scandens TaxID=2682957 RepID=A0ABR1JIU2_9AGAR